MMLTASSSVSISRNQGEETLTLVGRSRAGDGTCFVIPELHLMFDCGAPIVGWTPTTILLTHTHSDHVSNLANVLYSNSKSSSTIDVFLPRQASSLLQTYLESFRNLIECVTDQNDASKNCIDNHSDIQSSDKAISELGTKKNNFHLHGVSVDETIQPKSLGKRGIIVKTVFCFHRIVCLGYSLTRLRKKLKEEYAGLSKQEIRKFHMDGISVNDEYEESICLFLGDTTDEIFQLYPNVLSQHQFVCIECSFLDDNSKERARTTKHMHWDQLKPFVESNPKVLFILTHFSLKYTSLFIREFFIRVNENTTHWNVHPVLIESEVEMLFNQRNTRLRKNDGIPYLEEDAITPKCNCIQCSIS